jgi:hypothetical protein
MGIYIELPKDWAKYEIIVTDFHDNELEAKAIDLDLVRCGECKYWYKNSQSNTGGCSVMLSTGLYAGGFCSYGERRG